MGRARRVRGAALLVSAALILALASCDGSGGEDGAPTSPDDPSVEGSSGSSEQELAPAVTVPEGFVPRDTRAVAIAPFAPGPTVALPPVALLGGSSRIEGHVEGPDGPVAGATVRIERIEDGRTATTNAATGADGRFAVGAVHGGRYRVRAWSAPSLALTESQVLFVAEGEVARLTIAVRRFDAVRMDVSAAGNLVVGGSAQVRATVFRESVDPEGIVVMGPVPTAQVRLDPGEGAALSPGVINPATTDQSGTATWQVQCTRAGQVQVTLVSQLVQAPLSLVCAPAGPPGPGGAGGAGGPPGGVPPGQGGLPPGQAGPP